MKLKAIAAMSFGVLVSLPVCMANADDNNMNGQATQAVASSQSSSLKTEKERISYTIGVDIGDNLQAQAMEVDPDMVAQGIKDAMSDSKLLMTREEMQETIVQLQQKLVEEQKKKMEEMGAKNLEEGKAFLAKNKEQKGVVTLPSGLQYKVIEAGKGESPTADDTVTVDYEGKLVNGEVFDSSYKRGKPVQFKVSQVITGWQEALQKMKPGATWEVVIPPDLAYGDRGLGGPIGPNETLVFKVHLISVDDANDADNAAEEN